MTTHNHSVQGSNEPSRHARWCRLLESICDGESLTQLFAEVMSEAEGVFDGGRCCILLLNRSGQLETACGDPQLGDWAERLARTNEVPAIPQATTQYHASGFYLNDLTGAREAIPDPSLSVFQAFWSTPLHALNFDCPQHERILDGLFVIFRGSPGLPTEVEQQQMRNLASIVSFAITIHRARNEVRDSQHQLHELANAMPQMVWKSDAWGRCNYGNERLLQTIGPQGLENWPSVIHPDDRERVLETFTAAMQTGAMYRSEQRLFDLVTGKYRWYLSQATASRDKDGNIECWYGAATDIDELKRTEQQLRDERDRIRAIAASTPGVLFSYLDQADGSSCLSYAAPTLETVFGIKPEEVNSDASLLLNRIDPSDRDRIFDRARTLHCEGQALSTVFRYDHPQRGVRWIECNAAPQLNDDGSTLWHGVLTDITQRKELEERVLQSEKMEAIGRFAGGIAHDFNNLLTVIIGTCSLLHQQLNARNMPSDHVDAIQLASERAAGLTKQLLAFSRRQPITFTEVDVNEVIRTSAVLLKRLLPEVIQLKLDLADELLQVRADPTQIEQVIMNLAINARDAMGGGGILTISTRNIHMDNSARRDVPGSALSAVEIVVADTGTGIAQEIKNRVFEPFFSTKTLGNGTGLGLAVVHGIVTRCQGHIEIDSAPGNGTTVSIVLPALSSQNYPAKMQPAAMATHRRLVRRKRPSWSSTTSRQYVRLRLSRCGHWVTACCWRQVLARPWRF